MFPKQFSPRWYRNKESKPISLLSLERSINRRLMDANPPEGKELFVVGWFWPNNERAENDAFVEVVLRTWSKKIPPTTLKVLLKLKCDEWKAQHDVPRVPRRVVVELKDGLVDDLAIKQVPILRDVPVLFNIHTGDVLLSEASDTKADVLKTYIFDLLDEVYQHMTMKRPTYSLDGMISDIMDMEYGTAPEENAPYLNWVLEMARTAKPIRIFDPGDKYYELTLVVDDKVKMLTPNDSTVSVTGTDAATMAENAVAAGAESSQIEEITVMFHVGGPADEPCEFAEADVRQLQVTMSRSGVWKKVKFVEPEVEGDQDGSQASEEFYRLMNVALIDSVYQLFVMAYAMLQCGVDGSSRSYRLHD
jgi:hypothetical protein